MERSDSLGSDNPVMRLISRAFQASEPLMRHQPDHWLPVDLGWTTRLATAPALTPSGSMARAAWPSAMLDRMAAAAGLSLPPERIGGGAPPFSGARAVEPVCLRALDPCREFSAANQDAPGTGPGRAEGRGAARTAGQGAGAAGRGTANGNAGAEGSGSEGRGA